MTGFIAIIVVVIVVAAVLMLGLVRKTNAEKMITLGVPDIAHDPALKSYTEDDYLN